jgi:predicted translin family RNA/ssDNA-binding protein
VTSKLGGLADFTGEIGRMGVLKASARDVEAVIETMQAQLCVVSQLTKFNFGGKFTKKVVAQAIFLHTRYHLIVIFNCIIQ